MKRPPRRHNTVTPSQRVLALARRLGTLRTSDARAQGIPAVYLRRLVAQGRLQQIARGAYRLPSKAGITPHHGMAVLALRRPDAVVCLLSALVFHGLTTQIPGSLWITIANKAKTPRLDWPPLRVVRARGAALTEGIERVEVEKIEVAVYSPAKTIADCFKYRSKVGLDVALEALRAFLGTHRGTMNELEHFAQVCRVSRVMRPYLEALAQ